MPRTFITRYGELSAPPKSGIHFPGLDLTHLDGVRPSGNKPTVGGWGPVQAPVLKNQAKAVALWWLHPAPRTGHCIQRSKVLLF